MPYYQVYSIDNREAIFSCHDLFDAVAAFNTYRADFPDEVIDLRKIETLKDSRDF